MFAKPRPKKSPLPPPSKKRKVHAIEEISFDNSAREEYLTGFHKRKVQRQKHAQEEAAKRAREEKIEMRKQIREERRQEVEAHVKNIEAMLKESKVAGLGSEEEEDGATGDEEEWGGIEDAEEAAPVADLQPVDHEEEYIDEDLYTTVKIEAVSIDRDGLHNKAELEDDAEDEAAAEKRRKAEAEAKAKKPKKEHPTKKKKKFKYESKFDRQATNRKNNKRKGPPK
ncbi:hypothetical protein N0V93_006770 [Gnomoniopsis smithogilvyi]|uniref:Nucleolar protein 12 n=1 Tax=Gnomoniopsis smithogilvyi TaxID=1191159 RepID=A0A9W8YQG3_9PEZI|nr:hypothetical protein N0V93_006770 [Gnomoniopsis smithogilvyi]